MAKYLKASPETKSITPLRSFHYEQVAKAVEHYDAELSKIVHNTKIIKVDNVTDKKALRLLKGWHNKGSIDQKRYGLLRGLIEDGRYQNLSKSIKSLEKKSTIELIAELDKIQREYNLKTKQNKDKIAKREIEVILSETFTKG